MTDVETLRLDLSVPDEFCAICKKVPVVRLMLDIEVNGEPFRVSICRDCLAEYAPELLAEIENADLDARHHHGEP